MRTDRDGVLALVQEEYGAQLECLWADTPRTGVFRHGGNQKWFGLLCDVSGRKLGLETEEIVDILNVKCDPLLIGSFLEQPGYFPAYHMNKTHWLSILLDGTVPEETLRFLLDMSFERTAPKAKKPTRKMN